MVDTGYISPTNKIVLSGHVQSVELELEEAGMKPGILIKIGSTVNEAKIGTEGMVAYGWLGYEQSPIMYRPKDIDTAYAINARAAILHGPGMVLRAKLANGTNVVSGNKLVGTADGALKIWVPVPADAASGEEDVVATAMEDGTTTGAEINLLVRSKI